MLNIWSPEFMMALLRLTLLANSNGAGDLISSYEYTLGLAGNRVGVTEQFNSNGVDLETRTIIYGYDKLYRLTEEIIDEHDNSFRDILYTYDAVGNRLDKHESTDTGQTDTMYVYDDNDKLLSESVTTTDPVAFAPGALEEYYASQPAKPKRWPGIVLAAVGLLTLSLSLIVSAVPFRGRIDRIYRINKIGNDKPRHPLIQLILSILSILSAPLRLCVRRFRRSATMNSSRPSRLRGAFSVRSRLHAGVAVFLTACFIIGPEQVYAMHQEAIAYQMMAAGGIGQCPTGSTTVSYCYDANGSLTERYEGGQLVATYTFDAENRLVAYTPTTGEAATYTYDTDGIRNSKTVGTTATWHLTDKNHAYAQVLTETDTATGDLQVRYVHGDDLISQHRPNATGTRYYHYDGQMSTRGMTDAGEGASVTVTDRYRYDAFGVDLHSEKSTTNSYRYTGEQFDSAVGEYYLRARYYQQTAGRFLTVDTFNGIPSDPQSLHKYCYAHSNPIANVDPSGNASLPIILFSITIGATLLSIGLPIIAGVVVGYKSGLSMGRVFDLLLEGETWIGALAEMAPGLVASGGINKLLLKLGIKRARKIQPWIAAIAAIIGLFFAIRATWDIIQAKIPAQEGEEFLAHLIAGAIISGLVSALIYPAYSAGKSGDARFWKLAPHEQKAYTAGSGLHPNRFWHKWKHLFPEQIGGHVPKKTFPRMWHRAIGFFDMLTNTARPGEMGLFGWIGTGPTPAGRYYSAYINWIPLGLLGPQILG